MIDDKFQQHYRQQMSALMDGELAPDQARFLMRRMREDASLNETWERWQLCGDVLRGRAQAPAPQGFAERVSAAIAEQIAQPAANQEFRRGGNRVLRWGGGVIAASVALMALLIGGQQEKPDSIAQTTPPGSGSVRESAQRVAKTSQSAAEQPSAAMQHAGEAAAMSVASVAALPRRADDSRRGSATRNQQAARATANITRQALAAVRAAPTRAVAANQASSNEQDPFAGAHLGAATVRPWPRTNLPHFRTGGGYAAGYAPGEQATYYPFQPSLPVPPPVTPSSTDDQASPQP